MCTAHRTPHTAHRTPHTTLHCMLLDCAAEKSVSCLTRMRNLQAMLETGPAGASCKSFASTPASMRILVLASAEITAGHQLDNPTRPSPPLSLPPRSKMLTVLFLGLFCWTIQETTLHRVLERRQAGGCGVCVAEAYHSVSARPSIHGIRERYTTLDSVALTA